jgi:hypothetical protein
MSDNFTNNNKSILVIIAINISILSFMTVCGILFFGAPKKHSILKNEQSPINDPYGPPRFSIAPRNIDVKKRLAAEYKGQIEYYKGISALEESKLGNYYVHYIACPKDERSKAEHYYKTCTLINVYLKEDGLSDGFLDRLPYATRLYIRYKCSDIRKAYADNKIKYYNHLLSNIALSDRGKTSETDLANPVEVKDRDTRNNQIQN